MCVQIHYANTHGVQLLRYLNMGDVFASYRPAVYRGRKALNQTKPFASFKYWEFSLVNGPLENCLGYLGLALNGYFAAQYV